jgi:leucyl aminopeptidase
MKPNIQLDTKSAKSDAQIILIDKNTKLNSSILTKSEVQTVLGFLKKEIKNIPLPGLPFKIVQLIESKEQAASTHEDLRKTGNTLLSQTNKYKSRTVSIKNHSSINRAAYYITEGMALGNYQFIQYKKDAAKKSNSLQTIRISDAGVTKREVAELNTIVDASYRVKDLVNEPVNHLNAEGLADALSNMGKEAGIKVTVFNKKKIVELGMGGLLSVNQGSIDPPTFTIMEYKPANAVNQKPIVLVGKGVVYDTGGLSLKPTGNSMDYMKCDMAGAATMGGVIYAAAKMQWPIHIVALMPATDNRPGGNSFAPGDIIKMYNGLTVEMLNSDAEGRMILADALSYAKQYEPHLVIDMATLTGAAHRALGNFAIAYMSTADDSVNKTLEKAGEEVFERLVYFPLWDEYGELLDSDIADLKNVGGALAGHITAGKFLQKFTDYPWVHLDIAGLAFLHSSMSYRGKNATAIGLRLVLQFLKNQIK